MAGQPYKVGRFAHTLRVRLMREHLGVDVDAMYEEDLMASEPVKQDMDIQPWDPDNEQDPRISDPNYTQMGRSNAHRGIGTIGKDLKEAIIQCKENTFEGLIDSHAYLLAIHGTEDATTQDTGRTLRKLGFKPGNLDATADDKALEEERQGYDREGNKVPNFATSLVPTLEEKVVMEKRPPGDRADDRPILEAIEQGDEASKPGDNTKAVQNGNAEMPSEARLHDGSGQLFGAPADASRDATTDDEPPHARQGKDDSNEEEKAAVHARSILRKHLSARVGAKPWTLPVPGPNIDPHGFEDPVCDEFYKDVWLSAAAHNASFNACNFYMQKYKFLYRQRSIAKCSMPFRTTSSLPGNNIKSLSFITIASLNP